MPNGDRLLNRLLTVNGDRLLNPNPEPDDWHRKCYWQPIRQPHLWQQVADRWMA
jgi:hypothetical protein